MSNFLRLLDFLKIKYTPKLIKLLKSEKIKFNQNQDQWTITLTTQEFLPVNLICDLELAIHQVKDKYKFLRLRVDVSPLPVKKVQSKLLGQYLKTLIVRLYPAGHGICVDWKLVTLQSNSDKTLTTKVPVDLKPNYQILLRFQPELESHLIQYGWPSNLQLKFELVKKGVRLPTNSDLPVTSSPSTRSAPSSPQPNSSNLSRSRVELHVHTKMTTMDGVGAVADYFERAQQIGCAALAFTDRSNVQAFPLIERISRQYPNIKPIYGVQFNVFNSAVQACINPSSHNIWTAKYVFLDLETTGLSARFHEIIEFGLVLVDHLTDINLDPEQKKSFLVKPKNQISDAAQAISKIKDSDLAQAQSLNQVLPQVIKYLQNRVVVVHNADFDWNFLQASCDRLNIPRLKNSVLDTLTLARILIPKGARFNLATVVRYFKLEYNFEKAHRALYDAELTYQIFHKLLSFLKQHKITTLDQINNLSTNKLFARQKPFWVSVLCKNQSGLKTLFQLISKSHTKFFAGRPQISWQELDRHRSDLLIGSSGLNNEILPLFSSHNDEAIINRIAFYDYIEIPIPMVIEKFRTQFDFSTHQLEKILTRLIELTHRQQKLAVVASDAYYPAPTDWIIRDIYVKTEGLKGQRHYLYNFKNPTSKSPQQHLRSVEELMSAFKFLSSELRNQIILSNPQLIADQIKPVRIIKSKLFPPIIKSAINEVESLCWQEAKRKYGNPLPLLVKNRLSQELTIIFQHQFAVIFWIAEKIVKSSLAANYLVGSRGSVGSSLVAMLIGVTEVNPLPPHYLCPQAKCWFNDFSPGGDFKSGFDLPTRNCPRCNIKLIGDGHNIPFSTFLGLRGEKIPDIDLNFVGEYQDQAHEQVRKVFGLDHTFRAGTISTVANRTAFIYASKYFKQYGGKPSRKSDFETIIDKCTGIKRTTGQHPGGIVIIPQRYQVEDFTPVNYPANDQTAKWLTTHFDFEALHNNLLKIDILGHDDPRILRMLFDLTKKNPLEINFCNPEVMSLFTSTQSLNIVDSNYRAQNGALGIPEFGTGFVRRMLSEIKPRQFSDLVAISGLSHGKKVWIGNFQDLWKSGKLKISQVFACRDDIFLQLQSQGVEERTAFRIMERVRKGLGITKSDQKLLSDLKVESWLITACKKISYLFPKAHAVAYVMMAWRVAWYKINFPTEYYAAFFTIRIDNFDLPAVLNGPSAILSARDKLKADANSNFSSQLQAKKKLVLYEVALEMYARGVKLVNVDLNQSSATKFQVITGPKDEKVILPPLSAVINLGITVAQSIISARKQKTITSVTDLKSRTKVSTAHISTFKELKILTPEHERQIKLGFD